VPSRVRVRERERRVSCCAALVLNCGAWTANDWKLDFDELESKITPKSKILIFNNPTNIPGKVRPPHTAHDRTHRTTHDIPCIVHARLMRIRSLRVGVDEGGDGGGGAAGEEAQPDRAERRGLRVDDLRRRHAHSHGQPARHVGTHHHPGCAINRTRTTAHAHAHDSRCALWGATQEAPGSRSR
jgi:hypothetical protein